MNDNLKEILEKQDLNLGQTIDLVSVLDDITEELNGYDCKLSKAENEQKKSKLKMS